MAWSLLKRLNKYNEANCKADDVSSLISYIKMQRDFIYDNRNMF